MKANTKLERKLSCRLSARVPQAEKIRKSNQVNQEILEDKNIWSIRLGKSVKKLIRHQKHDCTEKLNWKLENALKEKTLQELPEAFGNSGQDSETHEKKLV